MPASRPKATSRRFVRKPEFSVDDCSL